MPSKEGRPIPSDLPAGHKRDELNRQITDDLEQRRAEDLADVGQERMEPSKFKHIDNEIAGPWEEMKKREREAGFKLLGMSPEEQMNHSVGVTNPKPGYLYRWMNHEDCYSTPEARAAVRSGLERAQRFHFFPVTDAHDPEVGKEFKKDGLRRWGDLVLWAIHIDDFKKVMAYNAMIKKRSGAVEENYVNLSVGRLQGNGRAYDQNDPRFKRYMGEEKTKPFTAQVIAEGDEGRN